MTAQYSSEGYSKAESVWRSMASPRQTYYQNGKTLSRQQFDFVTDVCGRLRQAIRVAEQVRQEKRTVDGYLPFVPQQRHWLSCALGQARRLTAACKWQRAQDKLQYAIDLTEELGMDSQQLLAIREVFWKAEDDGLLQMLPQPIPRSHRIRRGFAQSGDAFTRRYASG